VFIRDLVRYKGLVLLLVVTWAAAILLLPVKHKLLRVIVAVLLVV